MPVCQDDKILVISTAIVLGKRQARNGSQKKDCNLLISRRRGCEFQTHTAKKRWSKKAWAPLAQAGF